MEEKAETIQALIKAKQSRAATEVIRKEQEVLDQHQAATVLQGHARGYASRGFVAEERAEAGPNADPLQP